MAPKFIRWKHIVVDGLAQHSAQVFPMLEVGPGDKVIDAGCGFGDTTLELARIVGPLGSVTGLDCCGAFLDHARRDAPRAGIRNAVFLEADVETYPFEPVHDFCFSRFGTQFYEDPVAGLCNMRAALRPGGVMTMIVWRELAENPWLSIPRDVVLRFLPRPREDARTCGPGPFSMADPDIVTRLLQGAGYSRISFERIDAEVLVGRNLDEAVEFQLALGPAGEVFREAGDEATGKHARITEALKTELDSYSTPDGVMLNSSSWKVEARREA
ncbi:class I SAM-dependent methyltransferase [Mesorhizobium sp. WSM4976]|uniref:class I SAM-dependent methyltransferase n=1 Tax=Mesorhizobium sp. WSM4976 TaxID=3038549 RepID=UPI0024175FFF|nr:class I SAM-dependent methyltransferase [Mesorhizobium sp. WSM4976]MDG4892390.1 class I SAM-dependent methyltransferase [Mesorhizobium sp. WSM4976]